MRIILSFILVFLLSAANAQQKGSTSPNIILLTVDDMNWNSAGVYGCPEKDITPNIDRLAGMGARFEYAYTNIAVCTPSRGIWFTGKYPHQSGVESFCNEDYDGYVLPEYLQEIGYYTGIIGKIRASNPKRMYQWNFATNEKDMRIKADVGEYVGAMRTFLEKRPNDQMPFFLSLNLVDPHRPFYDTADNDMVLTQAAPSKIFDPEKIEVPAFLPDLPEVRKEVANYYGNVRRCDDLVGFVLKFLERQQLLDNTIIIFMSDHGMPFPFAKTTCYMNGLRIPWLVYWKDKIAANKVLDDQLVSSIDLMPTILDMAGITPKETFPGISLLPALKGEQSLPDRKVYAQFNETITITSFPSRALISKDYTMIFNVWSGFSEFSSGESTPTFKAIEKAASHKTDVAKRLKMLTERTKIEFYDNQKDPDALENLYGNQKYHEVMAEYRKELIAAMKNTGDPIHELFSNRLSEEAVLKYLEARQDEAQRIFQSYQRMTFDD